LGQEINEASIIGEWDKKTVGILLLDTSPESTFVLIDKLTSKIKAEGYKITESHGKEIFKVFTFQGAKQIKVSNNENRNLPMNLRVRDLSTFHNLETHHELIKCILDILVSVILLIPLSPIFLLCAILIKIDSPGPIFYRQTRIGKGGKHFTFLKFRTMHENSDEKIHKDHVKQLMNGEAGLSSTGRPGEKSYKLTEDHRVSRLGRFLRKTSIDELPQLINVLKGDMTLVGPRPHPVYEVELYNLWHSYRLNIKPGVTGLGQVYGRFNTDYEDVYRLDLQYFKNASFILDLKILLKTIFIVFSGRGAY
jgi:lipopolysaccharide/colanic/teichoic acid biosynthesis glycosyltransferase